MISGVLLAGVVFLLDVGLAVFLLPRRDIITGLVVGGVGFFLNRKGLFRRANRRRRLARHLPRQVLLVKVLLITVGLRAADADAGR